MNTTADTHDDAPLLETVGLGYMVSGTRILDDVSLTCRRGELIGVIGPNGAGKTTLLRLICGLLHATEGTVALNGKDLSAMSNRERALRVAFMSQEIFHDIPFSVMDVLLMGRYPHLERFQRESAEDFERARRMLSYVGLAGLEERAFRELSGGERQLVLFAKALVQETDLVLLDEPSSHLDIRHEDAIFSMAQELAREGKTVLASVHNLNVAAHYCARVLLLDKGKVAALGGAESVLSPELLQRVYGVKTLVSRNAATGSVTVSVVPYRLRETGARIHVIGGAGSAVNLTRELFRLGFTLTGGIAHSNDSDEVLWKNLGIECSSVGAFSRISDDDIEAASGPVEAADLVVLCCFPIGTGNLGNLRLAGKARELVVLEPEAGDMQRSFFTEEGRALFEELCLTARKSIYGKLVSELRERANSPIDRESGR
jgi:iron complex transport system ATP-binding protein